MLLTREKQPLPCSVTMKDSIYGLSLGTFVRQLMCGIVFFIPIVLWMKSCDWDLIVRWLQSLNATVLIAFGVVAACIGTIIYHVEKNLWAYAWQFVRLTCRRRGPKNGDKEKKYLIACIEHFIKKYTPLLLLAALMLVYGWLICLFLTFVYNLPLEHKALFVLFIILFSTFPIALFTGESKALVKHTQNMWCASSKLPDDFAVSLEKSDTSTKKIIELYELKEIARREAGWADYIHCGQTAAFAWILSCLLIRWWVNPWPETEPKWFGASLCGAIWLLAFEMICEIHKQRHIDKLLADYEKLKTEIGKGKGDLSNSPQQKQ